MVFLVILTAAVLETTTAFSVGVTSISRESFAVDDFTCSDAIRLAPPYVESPVILQLFNEHYLEMETNFLLVMKQHAPQRIGSLYLVCLDDASAATIDALFGLACVTIDGVTSFRSLMLIRVKIIVCCYGEVVTSLCPTMTPCGWPTQSQIYTRLRVTYFFSGECSLECTEIPSME